jgi:hypothetical protein
MSCLPGVELAPQDVHPRLQDEHLNRPIIRVHNPILGDAGLGVFDVPVAPVGAPGAGRGDLDDQVGRSVELLADAVGVGVGDKEDVQLADLVRPEADRQGGKAYRPKVIGIHKVAEKTKQGRENTLVRIGRVGDHYNLTIREFDETIRIG